MVRNFFQLGLDILLVPLVMILTFTCVRAGPLFKLIRSISAGSETQEGLSWELRRCILFQTWLLLLDILTAPLVLFVMLTCIRADGLFCSHTTADGTQPEEEEESLVSSSQDEEMSLSEDEGVEAAQAAVAAGGVPFAAQ